MMKNRQKYNSNSVTPNYESRSNSTVGYYIPKHEKEGRIKSMREASFIFGTNK